MKIIKCDLKPSVHCCDLCESWLLHDTYGEIYYEVVIGTRSKNIKYNICSACESKINNEIDFLKLKDYWDTLRECYDRDIEVEAMSKMDNLAFKYLDIIDREVHQKKKIWGFPYVILKLNQENNIEWYIKKRHDEANIYVGYYKDYEFVLSYPHNFLDLKEKYEKGCFAPLQVNHKGKGTIFSTEINYKLTIVFYNFIWKSINKKRYEFNQLIY